MPRKLRRFSLILAAALSLGLASQASHASNVAPRANAAELGAAGLFDAVWSWLGARFDGAAFVLTHLRPGGRGTRKDGGASDPNGSTGSTSIGSTGASHGGSVLGGISIQTSQP